MKENIKKLFIQKGLKITAQRLLIASIVLNSDDHPDVQEIHRRALIQDPKISIATVYRTLRSFEKMEIIKKYDFGTGRSRYENADHEKHDHLIDLKNNKVIEFYNEEIDELREKIVRSLGFKLIDHKLELYCVPIDNNDDEI